MYVPLVVVHICMTLGFWEKLQQTQDNLRQLNQILDRVNAGQLTDPNMSAYEMTPNPDWLNYKWKQALPRRFGDFYRPGDLPMTPKRVKGSMRTNGKVGYISRGRRTIVPRFNTDAVIKAENMYEINQTGQAWMLHQHFNREVLLSGMVEHLVQMMLSRMNCNVHARDSIPDVFKFSSSPHITCAVQRIDYVFLIQNTDPAQQDTTGQEDTVQVWAGIASSTYGAFRGKTFSDYVKSFTNLLLQKHPNSMILNKIVVYRHDDNGTVSPGAQYWFEIDNIMSRHMHVFVKNYYKIQNITPADTSEAGVETGTNINDVAANALQGSVYDFSNPRPRFRKDWLDEVGSHATNFAKLESTKIPHVAIGGVASDDPDMYFSKCAFFRDGGVETGDLLSPWRRPLVNVKTVFQNCTNAGSFVMKPGGFTTMSRVFTFKGTFRQLALGMYGGLVSAYDRVGADFHDTSNVRQNQASTGNCHMMLFRHHIRNKDLDSCHVKVVINHYATYSIGSTGTKKRKVLPRYLIDGS